MRLRKDNVIKISTKKETEKGQSLLEVSMITGVVLMALFAMTPMIKRFSQMAIKLTADQIGNQGSSEQDFSIGHTLYSYTAVHQEKENGTEENMGDVTYLYDEKTESASQQDMFVNFDECQNNRCE